MLARCQRLKLCSPFVLATLSIVPWVLAPGVLASWVLASWVLASGVLASGASARADTFLLTDGGRIMGQLTKRGPDGEYVITSEAGATVTLTRRQVKRVGGQDQADLEYSKRSRSLPDTVEAHRQLADWCKQQKLGKLADHHLRRLLELDPEDEQARLSLDYQRHLGSWLTRDEIMQQRGMQNFKGTYRTPQDIAIREQQMKRKAAEADWLGRIRTWQGWLGNPRKSDQAAAAITAIRDPHATQAIVKLLQREQEQAVRDLLTQTLAELDHPLAVVTLVDFSLEDPLPEVRLRCLDYLLARGQPISLIPYVNTLNERKNNNEMINRAAEALQVLGNRAAISPLIGALETTHKYKNGDAPPGDMNVGFSRNTSGNSLGGGGGGGGLRLGGSPKVVSVVHRNMAVRLALVELSGGLDFEFDEKVWRRWYVNEQIQDFVDTRRDQ